MSQGWEWAITTTASAPTMKPFVVIPNLEIPVPEAVEVASNGCKVMEEALARGRWLILRGPQPLQVQRTACFCWWCF